MFQIRFNPELGVEEMTDARGVTIQNVEGVVTAEAFTQAVRHRLGQ